MTELLWDGKYDATGKRAAPLKLPLQFQTVEVISESSADRQKNLFAPNPDNKKPWRNKLIWGDKKYVLPSLLPEFAGKVNLIYIDPPFDTGADFSFTAQVGDTGNEFEKQPSAIELKAYRDTWGKGLDSYLKWFYETATLLRDLLADNGSIYVHLDWHVGHYAKIILDEIFGYENFQTEIIWKRSANTGSSKAIANKFANDYDVIMYYVRSENFTFNKFYNPYSQEYIESMFKYSDKKGRYRLQVLATYSDETYERLKAEDKLVISKDSKHPYYKQYLDDSKGVPIGNLWNDITPVGPVSNQRVDYPTQKPEALLERIIKASSNEGDLVLDCFCGSGTTAAVAEKLGRNWITCDLGRFAIHTARKRLLQIPNVRPFEVLNLGKYERQAWLTGLGENALVAEQKYQAYLDFMIKLYGGERLQGNPWIHGRKKGRLVHIGSVDAPVSLGDVRSVVTEFKKLRGSGKETAPETSAVDILGWDFAFEINEMSVAMAAEMGVKVRPYKIPREVLEPKAVEQGDIQFFELAALEVGVKVKKKTAELALKHFNVPLDEAPMEIQKSVREWSDWIDYWAVDWDYKGDAFHPESQFYRTKKERKLARTATRAYEAAGIYRVLIKVIDILGNDTTKLVEVEIK